MDRKLSSYHFSDFLRKYKISDVRFDFSRTVNFTSLISSFGMDIENVFFQVFSCDLKTIHFLTVVNFHVEHNCNLKFEKTLFVIWS